MTAASKSESSAEVSAPLPSTAEAPTAAHSRAPFHRSLTRATLAGGVGVRGIASHDNVNIGWVTIACPEAEANMALWLAAPATDKAARVMLEALEAVHDIARDVNSDPAERMDEILFSITEALRIAHAAGLKTGER